MLTMTEGRLSGLKPGMLTDDTLDQITVIVPVRPRKHILKSTLSLPTQMPLM